MANIFDLFKKIENTATTSPITHIVVGLGNVGEQYERTRHNVGFVALDRIAKAVGTKVDRVKFHAYVGECRIGENRVLLMKPTTLMNRSGLAVGEAAAFYKIPAERIIVLHDEISFAPGLMRIRRKGSAGGHNGLKSLIEAVGDGFPRIKIGVGQKPSPDYDLADWVLGKMPRSDIEAFEARLDDIYDAVRLTVLGNIDEAMQKYSK